MRQSLRTFFWIILSLFLIVGSVFFINPHILPEKKIYETLNNALYEKTSLRFTYENFSLSLRWGLLFKNVTVYNDNKKILDAEYLAAIYKFQLQKTSPIQLHIVLKNSSLNANLLLLSAESIQQAFNKSMTQPKVVHSKGRVDRLIESATKNVRLSVRNLDVMFQKQKVSVNSFLLPNGDYELSLIYLSGSLELVGNIQNEIFEFHIDYPDEKNEYIKFVSMSGTGNFRNKRVTLDINQMGLSTSDKFPISFSTLTARGRIVYEKNLDFSLNLLPIGGGKIFVKGVYDLAKGDFPSLECRAEKLFFDYEGISFADLEVNYARKGKNHRGTFLFDSLQFSGLKTVYVDGGTPIEIYNDILLLDKVTVRDANCTLNFNARIDTKLQQGNLSLSGEELEQSSIFGLLNSITNTKFIKNINLNSKKKLQTSVTSKGNDWSFYGNLKATSFKSGNFLFRSPTLNYEFSDNYFNLQEGGATLEGQEVALKAKVDLNKKTISGEISLNSADLPSLLKIANLKYQGVMRGNLGVQGTFEVFENQTEFHISISNTSDIFLKATSLQYELWNLPIFGSEKTQNDLFNNLNAKLHMINDEGGLHADIKSFNLRAGEYEIEAIGDLHYIDQRVKGDLKIDILLSDFFKERYLVPQQIANFLSSRELAKGRFLEKKWSEIFKFKIKVSILDNKIQLSIL